MWGRLAWVAAGVHLLAQMGPFAQPPPIRRPIPIRPATTATPTTPLEPTSDLRGHFGVDAATRLLHSNDADDRLRGIERAATTQSLEGMSLMVHALEAGGAARTDTRALIAVVRGLASFTAEGDARGALIQIVNAPPTSRSDAARASRETATEEVDSLARVDLARYTAALALASSNDSLGTGRPAPDARAVDALVALARGGPGQPFAAMALIASPPAQPLLASGPMAPATLRLAALLGDLRALEAMRLSTHATEPATRAAALVALAEMGDTRVAEPARAAAQDADASVRAAAAEALVLIDAPDRLRAVEALVADDATALLGARLASRAQDVGVTKALAARVLASGDSLLRRECVAALGRATNAEAVRALTAFVEDPLLEGDAADALARSPSPEAMGAIEAMLASASRRRLGVRAYVVRAIARGERRPRVVEALEQLAASGDGRDRAVAAAALVALRERDVSAFLSDRDPRVRRAVATASLADDRRETRRALLTRLGVERDAIAQVALAAGLLDGDPDGLLTTTALVDRAESGGPDAPLAALALARRATGAQKEKVDHLFASRDPLLRAHVAFGLGDSAERDAVGRLANAYTYEASASVRRAIARAIASRAGDRDVPERVLALHIAARLDPDAAVRAFASRGLALLPVLPHAAGRAEVAWLRVAASAGAPPLPGFTGALVRSDGVAVPFAFDDDGYALVPGLPPGEARVVLAPRAPAYDALHP